MISYVNISIDDKNVIQTSLSCASVSSLLKRLSSRQDGDLSTEGKERVEKPYVASNDCAILAMCSTPDFVPAYSFSRAIPWCIVEIDRPWSKSGAFRLAYDGPP